MMDGQFDYVTPKFFFLMNDLRSLLIWITNRTSDMFEGYYGTL